MELITNLVCAICWLVGAVIAIANPTHDYRISYIIAAFCLSFTFIIHVMILINKRKDKKEEEKENENDSEQG